MNDLDVLERELGPGLRRTLDTVLAPRLDERARRATRRGAPTRHRFVGLATAAALTAGVVGTAVVLANRSPDDADPAGTAAPTATNAGDAPLPGSAPIDDVADPTSTDPVDVSGIFLPALPIDGFSLERISVERSLDDRADQHVDRYLRPEQEGEKSMVAVMVQPASPEALEDDTGSITVHGAPAHIFDSGAGTVVSWTEDGHTVSLRGLGVGWNEMAAYAEGSRLTSEGLIEVPDLVADGFVRTASATPPPDNAVTTIVSLVPDDATPGLFVDLAVRPNDGLMTIDTEEAEQRGTPFTTERTTIGGVPALVMTSPTDDLGTMTIVEWFRDGFVLSVTSRLPREQAVAIAESVEPATFAHAEALAGENQASLLALAELDRATLPNSFEVSVRDTGSAAIAVCLHQPVEHCSPAVGESSILGEEQSQTVVPFVVDGVTWQVGWAEGSHQPVWAEGVDDAGPLGDVAQGAAGTFVAFTSTSDTAGVRFDAGAFPIYPAGDPMLSMAPTVDLLAPA